MNALLYVLTGLAVILGGGVVIWSFWDTRKKYYEEYQRRKSK
jgi:hypothetical protein